MVHLAFYGWTPSMMLLVPSFITFVASQSLLQTKVELTLTESTEKQTPQTYLGGVVMYGDEIIITNQYPGHYMLERNSDPSFTTSQDRVAMKAAVWKIKKYESGQLYGSGPVHYMDEVVIENQYPGNYLLERNGNPSFTTDPERIQMKAAVWQILSMGGSDPIIKYGDDLIIRNMYHPEYYWLERNGGPSFSSPGRADRLDMKASVWQFTPAHPTAPPQAPTVPPGPCAHCMLHGEKMGCITSTRYNNYCLTPDEVNYCENSAGQFPVTSC
eukprot:TRINITY_DN57492_c0_g1_i1.p1 TRINITY_DN57492_c0_g1~~TRINITY_DN57492_c0_g1_i1.p1  ORF type:complete len:309 (+),score=14.60 TRINITY_DN57492_c0_g1_i1:117-929(+)